MEQGAVPAGLGKRTPGARAATGLRPPAIRPAARSLLMVSATRRQGGSAARSAARRRNDTAMERRGAQVSPIARRSRAPQGAKTDAAPRGAPSPRPMPRVKSLSPRKRGRKAAHPGAQRTGAVTRVCAAERSTRLTAPTEFPVKSALWRRCFAIVFLAWSARFPVGVKRH